MLFGSFFQKVGQVRLVLLGAALLLVPVSECAAQVEWQRTVKMIAPIEEGMVTRALTDSVVAMAEAQDLQQPQRTPKSNTSTSLVDIKEALSKEGLALTSATHVFITYRFALEGSSLKREIQDLHFIYRPTDRQGEDIPVLYVDLSENNLYQRLLLEKGTPSSVNEVVFHSFAEQIAFHSLRTEATVVQVGNRIIRDPEQAAAEKQQIAGTIRELTYN